MIRRVRWPASACHRIAARPRRVPPRSLAPRSMRVVRREHVRPKHARPMAIAAAGRTAWIINVRRFWERACSHKHECSGPCSPRAGAAEEPQRRHPRRASAAVRGVRVSVGTASVDGRTRSACRGHASPPAITHTARRAAWCPAGRTGTRVVARPTPENRRVETAAPALASARHAEVDHIVHRAYRSMAPLSRRRRRAALGGLPRRGAALGSRSHDGDVEGRHDRRGE